MKSQLASNKYELIGIGKTGLLISLIICAQLMRIGDCGFTDFLQLLAA
jgi:hypothetical protein